MVILVSNDYINQELTNPTILDKYKFIILQGVLF